MPHKLNLSLAIDSYDRTRPLVDGRVSPDGIDFTVFTYKSPERHRRMLKHAEFDVCELSLGSYLASVGQDYPFTAIPVFPHRKFRQSYFFVSADSGIETPADLEGKSVGIRRWQNTAALWMRGIAREYYDIDVERIAWYIDDEDEVDIDIPEAYDITRIPDNENINDLLVNGDLDAALYPKRPSSFVAGDPSIGRLFPDYKHEEMQYFEETGIFPIMHVIVIHDDIIAEHPWVATNVRKAFDDAKRLGLEELDHIRNVSLVWALDLLEEQRDKLGMDPWPSGLEQNRKDLTAVIDYARSDGLLSSDVDPADLFVESSIEELPGYA